MMKNERTRIRLLSDVFAARRRPSHPRILRSLMTEERQGPTLDATLKCS